MRNRGHPDIAGSTQKGGKSSSKKGVGSMEKERKQKLMNLGPEKLADGLLELANQSDLAEDLIERMIATPEENYKRFKKKLAALKRSRRNLRWGESSRIADELRGLLQDLKAGVHDPDKGVALMASFYETDKGTLGICDDSSGYIGDIYRYDARDLFVEYASRSQEKEKIADLIVKLNQDDGFGIRDALMDCAIQFLPETVIRTMIKTLQKLGTLEQEEYKKRHSIHLVESLARQVKDAPLFEKTRIDSCGTLSTTAYIDIARVYFESGDAPKALSWIDNIPEKETYQAYERDRLLVEIYKQLKMSEKLAQLLYRMFKSHRSIESLQELLSVIGEHQQEKIIEEEVGAILGQDKLRDSDASFLISVGRLDDAEEYLQARADQLGGSFYSSLIPLAETMEKGSRSLTASIIYRKLLDSILERGYTKAYPHGIRYLKKLDQLEEKITDWRNFKNHEAYKNTLRQSHGRKASFWSKYD